MKALRQSSYRRLERSRAAAPQSATEAPQQSPRGARATARTSAPSPAPAPETPAAPPVQAADAERARVLAIQALGRAGEEAIIAACIQDPSCTPAEAALRLRQREASARAVDAAEQAIINAGRGLATR